MMMRLGEVLPTYDIVWMCVPNSPLFQRHQVYDKPPFLKRKYMNGPILLYEWSKFSGTHVYAHSAYFFAQIPPPELCKC